MIRNEKGLFKVLERILIEDRRPFTCVELFDKPEVRAVANTVNRVSDYLGHMWRKGQVKRIPAPRTDDSSARWMYEWKEPGQSTGVEYSPEVQSLGNTIINKPNITIREHGEIITIELPGLSIDIRVKK